MKEETSMNLVSDERADSSLTSRRDFLKQLGGGIVILFTVGAPEVLLQERRGADSPDDFNAYLRIGEDGRVSCFTGKVELGQGIVTALAQILAEELNVTLDSVDMVMGDTDLCPWDMGTFGSRSIEYFGPPLRAAAAEARAVLIQMASEQLEIPAGRLEASEGFVLDRNNPATRISYASLTRGERIERRLEGDAPLKPASNYTISGQPIGRTDALEKVTGRAQYAGDIQVEGKVHARILRPPAHGARLRSADTSAAQEIEGVQVIRDGDLIAVLHPNFDVADSALSRINAQYDLPDTTLDEHNIFDHLLDVAPEGEVIDQQGDLEDGERLATANFDETYFQSYVAHAPIEPHTAVVKIEGNRVTVWASTQRPFGVKEEVAGILGTSSENVRVITPYVGGGFGGKNSNRQAVEAARLARLAGKPVQVAWSREEEFFFDTFMPAAIVKIKSGLNNSNRIVYWDYKVYYAGGRSSQPVYDIPHYRVLGYGQWRGGGQGTHPFSVGAWRAPGSNTNVFAKESHIDIMASEAGVDPLEFRLMNLRDERMIRVLTAAAERFGWTPAVAPSGRGYGIACVDYLGTYVASIAEVDVDRATHRIKVERVVSAQDMGQVINPEGAAAQMEGCITMGLGYALAEEIHFWGGDIITRNFDTYEIPRFSWTPRIETILIDNPELPAQGGGEPAITCMGGVIANALFDAVGARLHRLPLSPERIRTAMQM